MTQPAPPSGNNANSTSLHGAMSFALRKQAQNTDDMLPAKVLAYDRVKNRARLQIMVPFVTTAKEVLQRAIVASVPVLQMGGGGFVMSFPLSPGDLGWIKATDRDISQFKATFNSSSGPPTQRMHSFEDAMFIPDTMFRGVTLADDDGFCLQSLDGSVSIVLVGNHVNISAPNVTINGTTTTVNSTHLNLNASTKITMTTPLIEIDADDCEFAGINFINHVHTGVQTGSGESGPPVNP